jgi:hypothetical protein
MQGQCAHIVEMEYATRGASAQPRAVGQPEGAPPSAPLHAEHRLDPRGGLVESVEAAIAPVIEGDRCAVPRCSPRGTEPRCEAGGRGG